MNRVQAAERALYEVRVRQSEFPGEADLVRRQLKTVEPGTPEHRDLSEKLQKVEAAWGMTDKELARLEGDLKTARAEMARAEKTTQQAGGGGALAEARRALVVKLNALKRVQEESGPRMRNFGPNGLDAKRAQLERELQQMDQRIAKSGR